MSNRNRRNQSFTRRPSNNSSQRNTSSKLWNHFAAVYNGKTEYETDLGVDEFDLQVRYRTGRTRQATDVEFHHGDGGSCRRCASRGRKWFFTLPSFPVIFVIIFGLIIWAAI